MPVNGQEVLQAYREAHQTVKQLSEKDQVPFHFFGYSFGGLIGTAMLSRCPFDKIVLLAPAIKIRIFTHALRPLLPYISRIISIPLGNSELEKHYRFHLKGTPKEVYESFFEIYQEFNQIEAKSFNQNNTKGIVFSHPKDELIAHKQLKKWVKEKTNWQFHTLSNKGAQFKRFKHLVFDPRTLGRKNYQKLLSTIHNHLRLVYKI